VDVATVAVRDSLHDRQAQAGARHPPGLGRPVEAVEDVGEVVGCNAAGVPTEVDFRFDAPLEDPRWRFVRWRGERYVPFVPPAVGTIERLPAQALAMPHL